MLAQSLVKAKQFGLNNVLVTCEEANRASAKVIENNGGKLTEKVIDSEESLSERC